jgi:hypothetical protein
LSENDRIKERLSEEDLTMSNNRLNDFGMNHDGHQHNKLKIELELEPNERLLRIILEIPDDAGVLVDDLPEDYMDESFFEEELLIREREMQLFTKVLHYNNLKYRVETVL